MNKIVGYVKGVSQKTGKPYCRVYVMSELTEREKEMGFVGMKTVEEYLPDGHTDDIKPSDIGKELTFTYDVVGNRAYKNGVIIK